MRSQGVIMKEERPGPGLLTTLTLSESENPPEDVGEEGGFY